MKVLLFTAGSRGDIQPFVALGRELINSGHDAVLIATQNWTQFAQSHGVPIRPIENNVNVNISSEIEQLQNKIATTNNWFNRIKLEKKKRSYVNLQRRHFLDAIAQTANEGGDIIVYRAGLPHRELSLPLGAVAVPASPNVSWAPTKSLPDPNFPFRVPTTFNKLTFIWANWRAREAFRRTRRFSWCQQISGRRLKRETRPKAGNEIRSKTFLHAISRFILPEGSIYPEYVHTTGFWFLPPPPNWTPPQDLSDFLNAGDKPIYIGFGSFVHHDSCIPQEVIVEAIKKAGLRAIIVGDYKIHLHSNEPNHHILYQKEVPLDWLLPRMAAVVHHGGTGTTGAAMLSGRPQIICPLSIGGRCERHFQYNAQRMYEQGVALVVQSPRNGLESGTLAKAIRKVITDGSISLRAHDLARNIQNENGVEVAVKLLEQINYIQTA